MRKPCLAFLLALLFLAAALPMAALAETRITVDYLGRDVIVPDGWTISGARVDSGADEGEVDYSFFYKDENGLSEKETVLILHDFGGTDARIYIPLTYENEEWATTSAKEFGLETVETVAPFTFWTEGRQISGNTATGTVGGKPWIWMALRFPSVYDSVVRVFYFAPIDGSVDTSWFLGVIEAQFPEIASLELIPQSTAADAPKDAPEATPEPTPVPTPEPTIADFTPQEVIAFTPPDFGGFFADDSGKTYLKLSEAYGLPLAPLTEWAKVYGLAEPKSAKNGLSFAVLKGRGPEWNGLKKVDVAVPADAWVNKKSLLISFDGLRAVASALSGAWTGPKPESAPAPDPHELSQLISESVEEAYLRLGETYGLPLTPLTEWAKVKGLTAPKTAAKDGSLSFTVSKGRGGEWNGLKKVEVPVPAGAWINQKGMRLSLDGLRAVVAALSGAWTEPKAVPTATPKAGKGGAALMTTPFMTEEQIKATFQNYEWEYLITYVYPEMEGRDAADQLHRNVVRQYPGGYYDESDSLYTGERSFYAYYYPFDKDYSYRFDLNYESADDFTAYVRPLSPDEIKERAQEHLLAQQMRWTISNIIMDKLTVVERGVDVAGRSTTRYAGGTYSGEYIDFWVDDEYGLLLKYATVQPQYGMIATFETTNLTFGNVTGENVIDTARYTLPLVDDSMTWQYEVVGGEATVTKLLVDYEFTGDIAIPAELGGYPVTAIGDDAIGWREGIKSITIPNSVTVIGKSAFSGCSGLTELVLPPRLTHIGEYAFLNCSGLTELIIPSGVTSIGSWAFSGCNNLTDLTLPSGLTTISDYAFAECEGLTTLSIPSGVTFIGEYAFGYDDHISLITEEGSFAAQYAAMLDSGWYFTFEGGLTIQGCSGESPSGEVVIPSGVVRIGEGAFSGCGDITDMILPDSLIVIDKYAFVWCKGLTRITIPASVTSIGYDAFEGCDDIVITVLNADGSSEDYTWESIRLAKAIRYPLDPQNGACDLLLSPDPYGDGLIITGYVYTAEDGWLKGDLALPAQVAGKAVTAIGQDAFWNCNGLTSMTIPDSVTSIDQGAFASCGSLTTLTIPSSVVDIGMNPFIFCESLDLAVSPDNPAYEVVNGVLFDKQQKILVSYPQMREGAYIVPDGTLRIGNEAFFGCEGLTRITFPKSLTDIGDQAFYRCVGLTDVTIPNSVNSIGNYTFEGCSELVSVTIPDSVYLIAWGAFDDCDKLTLTLKKDSYAEEYAKEHQVRYTVAK